ncbi:MAG: extracellular solute-binding protein [Hyphomicrobiales bacterium]|nr:extracellular solute-binding protein [Hyphomicrobiales bacterium]
MKMRIAAFAVLALVALDAHAEPSHGIAAFDQLKYPPDFSHFEYTNPDAPKGGTLSLVGSVAAYNASFLTFDTLNGYILKGNAAQGLHLVFDTLMTRATDEEDSLYGLVARSVEFSDGHATATFKLREAARFHDNTPLTSEDAAFSLEILQQHGHPLIRQNLRNISAIETPDAHTLTLRLEGPNPKDLATFAATTPIFSKAFYENRDFTEATLEPPLGSGPYRIDDFAPGRYITYKRVPEYWGADIPVNRGRWNFDAVRYEYFRDRTAQFEAFKAGAYRFREEFTSKVWATEYNFPAIEDGRVVKLALPNRLPSGAQGWFLNTRREKFSDPRVREALINAFDFEWSNRTLFYEIYIRTESFFENSPMKAEGLPSADEIALLEPWREQLPEEVFGEPYRPPVSDGSGKDRKLLRTAARLLDEAGWSIQDGERKNSDGTRLSIEFLIDQPTFERVLAPYIKNLEALGIEASIRLVDSAQYQERRKSFDYDVVAQRFAFAPIPGVEIRDFWTSPSANTPGSYNLSGIADPAADALTEAVLSAQTREEQITAARALDRVLRAGRYWVPHWYKAEYTLAFWDEFERPKIQPRYGRGVIDTWWHKSGNGEKSAQ